MQPHFLHGCHRHVTPYSSYANKTLVTPLMHALLAKRVEWWYSAPHPRTLLCISREW